MVTRSMAASAAFFLGAWSSAAPYAYALIDSVTPGSVHATLNGGQGQVGMTYSGPYSFADPAFNSYDFPDAYTSDLVSNCPTPGVIGFADGSETVHTISFSSAVSNPVLSFVSVGQGGTPVNFDFSETFDIVSQGGGAFGLGTMESTGPHSFSGMEGHGTIRFHGTFQNLTFTAPDSEYWYGFTVGIPGNPIYTLSGNISLMDWANMEGQHVTLEMYNRDTQDLEETHDIILGHAGAFIISVGRTGEFDVAVKGSHWLRRMIPGVVIIPITGGSGLYTTLINGDSDGDNEVGLGDFGLLSSSFGTFEGDPGYLASTDLDGDLEVGLGDFGVLSAYFGEVGD